MKSKTKTILIFAAILAAAFLIAFLDGGAVQAIGTHDELLADNRIYQEIYNQQNRKGGEE